MANDAKIIPAAMEAFNDSVTLPAALGMVMG